MDKRKIIHICDKAITAYARGDSDALSVVYDCMARMIMATALAITDSREDAEDVLQDTMISVARFAKSYRSGTNAKAWVLAIARNKALDLVRRQEKSLSLEEAYEKPIEERGFERAEALDMLGTLDEAERQLVLFRLYAKLSYREIADIMEISVSAAQKKYQRAIAKLRKSEGLS
ncbi:MAG: RNA polymerase sigma factor [Butyrivibrio sp.]|nr:RNA polymerase sigma factor [Butyrivibrio sp.]